MSQQTNHQDDDVNGGVDNDIEDNTDDDIALEPTEGNVEVSLGPGDSRLKKIAFRIASIFTLFFIGIVVWAFCFPHLHETDGPVPLDRARHNCPIPLPDSAREIRYSTFRFFLAHEAIVRFEAPADECISHIETVTSHWVDDHIDPPPSMPGKAEKITESPKIKKSENLDTSWFDINSIRDGVHCSGGPGIPEIWVDKERGVFYYYINNSRTQPRK